MAASTGPLALGAHAWAHGRRAHGPARRGGRRRVPGVPRASPTSSASYARVEYRAYLCRLWVEGPIASEAASASSSSSSSSSSSAAVRLGSVTRWQAEVFGVRSRGRVAMDGRGFASQWDGQTLYEFEESEGAVQVIAGHGGASLAALAEAVAVYAVGYMDAARASTAPNAMGGGLSRMGWWPSARAPVAMRWMAPEEVWDRAPEGSVKRAQMGRFAGGIGAMLKGPEAAEEMPAVKKLGVYSGAVFGKPRRAEVVAGRPPRAPGPGMLLEEAHLLAFSQRPLLEDVEAADARRWEAWQQGPQEGAYDYAGSAADALEAARAQADGPGWGVQLTTGQFRGLLGAMDALAEDPSVLPEVTPLSGPHAYARLQRGSARAARQLLRRPPLGAAAACLLGAVALGAGLVSGAPPRGGYAGRVREGVEQVVLVPPPGHRGAGDSPLNVNPEDGGLTPRVPADRATRVPALAWEASKPLAERRRAHGTANARLPDGRMQELCEGVAEVMERGGGAQLRKAAEMIRTQAGVPYGYNADRLRDDCVAFAAVVDSGTGRLKGFQPLTTLSLWAYAHLLEVQRELFRGVPDNAFTRDKGPGAYLERAWAEKAAKAARQGREPPERPYKTVWNEDYKRFEHWTDADEPLAVGDAALLWVCIYRDASFSVTPLDEVDAIQSQVMDYALEFLARGKDRRALWARALLEAQFMEWYWSEPAARREAMPWLYERAWGLRGALTRLSDGINPGQPPFTKFPKAYGNPLGGTYVPFVAPGDKYVPYVAPGRDALRRAGGA